MYVKRMLMLSLMFGCLLGVTAVAAEKPNIIFILTDDQGYGDVSAHGNPVLKTPNIDKLREQSVRFTDFSVSPSCAPTRCALLTGMHEFKSGVTHTINPYRNMNRERLLISQLLKAQGYATGHFGKWHLGIEEGYAPHERGFDVSVITRRDDKKEHFNPVFVRNGVPQERRRGYRTDLLFDDAMAFVEDNKTRPFFCYLATHSPHSPKRCPPKYAEPYKERTPKLASFFGMIANIDENVGRLLSKLDELDLARDTLVIFMNDNGGTSGVDLWNAGMRGTKGTPWRGGTRAISFWRLPSRFKPCDVDAMAAHVDLYPTLAELAGATVPETDRDLLDGISLLPLLESRSDETPYNERFLVSHRARWTTNPDDHKNSYVSLRWGSYQLININWDCGNDACKDCRSRRDQMAAGVGAYTQNPAKHHKTTDGWELYDLSNDIGQDHNIAVQHPEWVDRLSKAYDQWWKDVRPMMINEPK